MYSTKIEAMIARTIRQHSLLQATIPARSSNGFLGSCFSSTSEGESEGVGDKAKQTMDNVMGAAKDSSQKVKDRVTGSGTGTGTGIGTGTGMKNPSKDPDMKHGVETTDSSCEDVRGRPGGYN